MRINTTYTANPTYTNLMNRERTLEAQIKRLQDELQQVRANKQNTLPFIEEK